jgi:lysophospholipase L1-like esterase
MAPRGNGGRAIGIWATCRPGVERMGLPLRARRAGRIQRRRRSLRVVWDVVLAGDSHLGRFTKQRLGKLEALLPNAVVHNCAAGGLNSADLVRQAPALARIRPSVVAVSVGANDAAPWKRVSIRAFRENLRSAFVALDTALVYLAPPPVDESQQSEQRRRSNADLATYAAAAQEVCQSLGAMYLDTGSLLSSTPASADMYVAGGVHLADHGYDRLIPVLARYLAIQTSVSGSSSEPDSGASATPSR